MAPIFIQKLIRQRLGLQVGLWELKVDLLPRQPLVDGRECLHLVLNVGLLVLIQMTFEQTSSIQLDPDSFPDNLSGINEIIQNAVVDSLQGAGPGSLLLQLVCLPCGLGQDGSLSDEHNMLATELLIQLTDQPCLNLPESFQLRNWHEDHDCFLACGALDLLGGGNVQLAQGGLQVPC